MPNSSLCAKNLYIFSEEFTIKHQKTTSKYLDRLPQTAEGKKLLISKLSIIKKLQQLTYELSSGCVCHKLKI
jgi:hypothetical protein